MISNLAPYPEMRDSGVEWLGDVPKHWEVVRLGYRYEQCLGKMLDGKRITGKYLVPYLRNIDVQWNKINVADLRRMDIRPDEIPRYTVQPGDLLVCEGGEVGRCAIWKGEITRCGFQKALHRLRPWQDERDRPRFLYYALSVAVACRAFADGHESTIAHLTGEKLRRHRFAFPSVDEQTAIARFLDNADRRIRRYIRAKEKLIELVEEQKQSIIHQAVTGGIDVRTGQPYPAYRDSGVEWLGKVPDHWQVRRNGGLFSERSETGYGSLPILEVSIHEGVRIRDMECGSRKQRIEEKDRYKRGKKGDITYNTMRMWQGAVGVVPADGLVSPAYVVMNPLDCVTSSYYGYLFRTNAYKGVVKAFSRGIVSDRDRLYWDEFKRIASIHPPMGEQAAIVRFLASTERRISARRKLIKRQIELLREYRTRLVSDVVTGKLDVHDAATNLPGADSIAGTNRGSANHTETNSETAKQGIAQEAIR